MNHSAFSYLQAQLATEPHEDYPIHSRVHGLRSFKQDDQTKCFIKREDELGFGISGVKLRKYRNLLPYIQHRHYREVVVIGGPFSNHVLAITQLLIEKGITPTLFLKGPIPSRACGNYLLTKMLVPQSSIHWFPKTEWMDVEKYASSYVTETKQALVLPEGGTLFPAFLGALTLALDIVSNEAACGHEFDHLFIEAGTGWSAAALLLAFAYLEKQTFCYVLLLAEDREGFHRQLERLHVNFEHWLGKTCPFPMLFACEHPMIAPSFGSTNKALFQFMIKITRAEGFFLDPIYSGKLFFYAKEKIEKEQLVGNVLLIHSGGALTIAGFQDQLETYLNFL